MTAARPVPAAGSDRAGRWVQVAAGYRTVVHDEGEGRPVVLLHGTPFDSRSWDAVVHAVGGRVRTVRFDARGHGSASGASVADPTRLARDVVAVLDHLGLAEAHVVGHSWGGQIAQQVALDHPARVSRLSLVCTRASPFPDLVPVARGLRDGTGDPEASLARWFTPAELAAPDEVVDAVRACVRAADPERWAAALELIATFDVFDDLSRIRVPTQLLGAELDGISDPGTMARMADALADSAVQVLAGARHLVPIQHPDRVADLLVDRCRPVPSPHPEGLAP